MPTKQHKHQDAAFDMGLHRSHFTATVAINEPRKTRLHRSPKGWRQMRSDLNGAFGNYKGKPLHTDLSNLD